MPDNRDGEDKYHKPERDIGMEAETRENAGKYEVEDGTLAQALEQKIHRESREKRDKDCAESDPREIDVPVACCKEETRQQSYRSSTSIVIEVELQ